MQFFGRLMCLILVCLLYPTAIYSAEKTKEKEQALPEVVVESERLVEKQETITIKAEGLPAEVDVITKEDLKRIPYTGDFTEILRTVPGVTTARLTMMDINTRINMRGFWGYNVIAFYVDGMPMNRLFWGPGAVETSGIVPEMIERIEVIKGPFSALYGNFGLAGAINVITKKSDSSPSLAGYGGSYDTWRGVGVMSDSSWSKSLGNVTPFLVWEGYSRGGYRHDSDYQRGQFFNKFTVPVWQGYLSVRAQYLTRTWGDPGWLSISQMKAGLVNRRDAVNLSDRGDSEVANVVINYSPKGGEEGLHASLYYNYEWLATGRTFPPSPQGRSDNCGNTFGYRLLYDYRPLKQLSLMAGTELRYDSIRVGGWSTLNYNYYSNLKLTSQFHQNQFSNAFFVQGQYKPFSFFKIVGGGRFDMFNIEVDNQLFPQNSGTATPSLWSPKIGFVITPYKDINIFANKGRGFRSPSVSELSPNSATRKANFDLGLAVVDTWDVGFNALLFKRLYIGFDYFNTLYQREQWLNPSTNSYESLGASKRTGYEVEVKIFLTKDLTIYGSWAHVRARLKNPLTPGAYYILNQAPDTSTLGFNYQKIWGGGDHQIGLDFCYYRVGRSPANTSGTVIGSQFDQYRGKISYRYKKWTWSVDATLTPRKYASDYYYVPSGTNLEIVPIPTWDVLAGIKYQF